MDDLFEKFDNQWRYRSLFIVIVGGLLLFFAWASIAQIDEQVRAVGRIVPSGKVRTVQHLEGGIVKEIMVEEGQMVNEGDPLFAIDNTKAESSQQEIKVSVDALKIKLARLQAEQSGASALAIPDDLLEKYPELVKTEKVIFDRRREELLSKLSGLEEKRRQKALTLETLQERRANLVEESSIAGKQESINKNLRELGAVSQSRYLESQSIVKNFETRIADVERQIPITRAEKTEVEQSLAETTQNYQAGVAQDINEAEVDIRKLSERQVNFDEQVSRMVITSPVKGVVKERHVNTIGGVVKAGETLVDILPVDEILVVEGQISTNDRGKVYPGLGVEAVITAYDYATYGTISGKLTEISADSFSDQQKREFYKVRAELNASDLKKDMTLYPGMTVQLNILAGRTSILKAILKPLLRIKNEALKEA